MHNAITEATRLGFDTVQVFTKNQQQWAAKPLEAGAIGGWKEAVTAAGFGQTVAHDSYLINLASGDDALWQKSIDAFVEEVRRCDLLGIPLLVTHPGAHLGTGEEVGLARVAKALDRVFKDLGKASTTTVCLEITAGQGTSLGYKLEHLAEIMSQSKYPERLAVCLDTAHLLAAGYDFRGAKYGGFVKELKKTVGVKLVRCLHLNDSKKDLGSRVDRHEHIGHGFVGIEGFRPLVNEAAFRKIPKILETAKEKNEKGEDWDAINLATLKGLIEK
jgi:deoxyribonuclease-4